MWTLRFVLPLACTLLLGISGCGTRDSASGGDGGLVETGTNDSRANIKDSQVVAPEEVTVLLAADYATGEGCGDDLGNAGCDIYRATVNVKTLVVRDAVRVTSLSGAETFPAGGIVGDGQRSYYRLGSDGTPRSIGYVVGAASGTLLSNASYPTLLDRQRLVFVDEVNNLALATLSAAGDRVEKTESLAAKRTPPRGDPDVSPDGAWIVFNETGEGVHGTSQAKVLHLASRKEMDVSTPDGSGHCAFSGTGSLVVCDSRSAGGLRAWTFDGQGVSGERMFLMDPALSDLDPDFAPCRVRSVNYPAFCGSDDFLLVAVSCSLPLGDAGIASAFSKVFLVHLDGGKATYLPLGKAIGQFLGASGRYHWSPICTRSL